MDVELVQDLLNKLVLHLMPSDRAPQYFKYALRLLSIRAQPIVQDDATIRNQLTKRVNAKNPALTKRFQDLCLRLARSRSLSKRWAIMYLFGRIEDDKASTAPFVLAEPFKKPFKSVPEAPMDLEPSPTPNQQSKPIDTEFMKDILFAFQGIDGNSILFSQMDECYIVQPQLQVSESLRKLVSELCEIGWLYRQVSEYVASHSEDANAGLVQQSFCSALQLELSEYYRQLALLQQKQQEFSGTSHLLKLRLWVNEPLQRMKWLAVLVKAATGLKGGAIVSSVFSFSLNGDTEVSDLVNRILQETAKPVFEMIKTWMTRGEFYDPFTEFFIKPNPGIDDEHLWTQGYSVRDEMVPAFLNTQVTAKILLTGKSVSFLKRCCGVEERLDLDELPGIAGLEEWVEAAAVVSNSRLVKVLISQYRFLDHCEALRKFLLMGQGDFHHHLMESLWDELSQNASAIYRHNLVALLEGAIRASNAQYDDSEFLNRIDVRLLEASPGEIGWDVFILEYRMDAPLNTVFTAPVLEQYLRLFKFFWRLKRVEYFLTTKSYRHTFQFVELMKHDEIRPHLHRCQLIRHEIAHFVSNLMSYLMVEVVESGWKEYTDSVVELNDMDQLIETHKTYLNRLISRAFLSPAFDFLYKKLLNLLELALRFVYSQEALYLSAEEELHRLKGLETKAKFLDAIDMVDSDPEEYASRISTESISDIQQVSDEFKAGLLGFQRMLEEEDRRHLKFLSFRLDFNEFYASQSTP